MTEAIARKAAERVAATMGRGWRASDGDAPSYYRILDSGKDSGRMRCRLEFGDNDFAYVVYQGDSWREALDDFFMGTTKAPAWRRSIMEKLGGVSSAEELVLKAAISGEISTWANI